MKAFADRFITKVRELGHPLCVGIDPHLGRIPPLFGRGAMTPSAPETVEAVLRFSLAVIKSGKERREIFVDEVTD